MPKHFLYLPTQLHVLGIYWTDTSPPYEPIRIWHLMDTDSNLFLFKFCIFIYEKYEEK